ncbi:MAG: WGxxGxxG family protein [Waterburya sp.]
MNCFQLSKVFRLSILTLSLAVLPSGAALAQNPNQSPTNSAESAQQNFDEAQQQFQRAAQEAQKGVEAAGKAAQQEIDKVVKETERNLSQEANWGWLGVLGLLGLFGLAGRGRSREKTVSHQQD